MYKPSPSGSIKSNRSRGFKVKRVLQICVLLAVCFWLIYQAKQPRKKITQFNGDDRPRLSRKTGNANEKVEREDDDVDSTSTREAQEKLYKADDASSAVAHDTRTVTAESNIGGFKVSNGSSTESNPTTSSVLGKTIQGHPRFPTQDDRWSSTVDTANGASAEMSETVGETGRNR